MITTVTTTTTAVSSSAAVASTGLAANLCIIGTAVLILLLIAKELISAHKINEKIHLSNVLNIPIVPLLMTFFLSVFTKIAMILG